MIKEFRNIKVSRMSLNQRIALITEYRTLLRFRVSIFRSFTDKKALELLDLGG